jgi:outer membrane protein assembly factor BamE (lipoprotein component of BamABCDE complex)
MLQFQQRRRSGMKSILAMCLLAVLAGCAAFDGRGLTAGQSTLAEVERIMGTPAERRQVGGETWLYYPRQPYGRKTFVARVGADGRLIALEQRLTDENVAKIVPNTTRAEQVREIFGPPYATGRYNRLDRNVWTWHMRRFGDPGSPAQLNVQMSPDGVVREVVIIDESDSQRSDGVAMGFGSGGGVGIGVGMGF